MLDTIDNLGLLYKAQGKLAEAEKIYQRALDMYETALLRRPRSSNNENDSSQLEGS